MAHHRRRPIITNGVPKALADFIQRRACVNYLRTCRIKGYPHARLLKAKCVALINGTWEVTWPINLGREAAKDFRICTLTTSPTLP